MALVVEAGRGFGDFHLLACVHQLHVGDVLAGIYHAVRELDFLHLEFAQVERLALGCAILAGGNGVHHLARRITQRTIQRINVLQRCDFKHRTRQAGYVIHRLIYSVGFCDGGEHLAGFADLDDAFLCHIGLSDFNDRHAAFLAGSVLGHIKVHRCAVQHITIGSLYLYQRVPGAILQLFGCYQISFSIGIERVDGCGRRIGEGHFHLAAIGTINLEPGSCIGDGNTSFRIHLDHLDEALKVGVVDEIAVGLAVLSDIHFKIVHQLSAFPAFCLVDNIGSIGQLFGLCKAILVTGENVALRFLCSVIAACRLEINLELRTDFRGFDLGFSVVGMLDDGDVAFDNLFSHIIGGVVQLDLIQFRLRTYLVNSGIQQIPLAGVDFTNRPVGITDIIIRGKLTVLIGGIAVDKGVALIKPIGGSGKRTIALGRAGFYIAFGYSDAELFQHIVHTLVRDFVPGNRGALGLRHHIADRRINLLQHEVGADEDVFKPRHTAGVGHSVFIHRQARKRSPIEMEGHSLHQTVLAGLCDLQTAALQHVVKVHGGRLAADNGHALGSLGFIFVNRLLGHGINTGIEVGDVDFARRIGGLGGAVSLAGNREGDALYFAVLGSFDQLHVAGFDFQIEIAHHLVGNGSSIGGEVLFAAAGNAVRPNHNTAALGRDFFRLDGHRAFDGLGGSNGELVAIHREIQAGGAAGEGVISQHVVFIRESEGILLAIPFQLIGTGVCGAAEKAGQHGVALDRALNGGILAENLAVQGMVGADIFRHVVFALGIGVHMVKLAVALAHDSFPNKKLGSDISRDLAGVLRVPTHP